MWPPVFQYQEPHWQGCVVSLFLFWAVVFVSFPSEAEANPAYLARIVEVLSIGDVKLVKNTYFAQRNTRKLPRGILNTLLIKRHTNINKMLFTFPKSISGLQCPGVVYE